MYKRSTLEYSLEGLLLNLKFQYSGFLMQRLDSLEKTDVGKDWRQEKGTTEDKMVVQHHRPNRHGFEQNPGDSGGQRSLACYSLWGSQRVRHDLATQRVLRKRDSQITKAILGSWLEYRTFKGFCFLSQTELFLFSKITMWLWYVFPIS